MYRRSVIKAMAAAALAGTTMRGVSGSGQKIIVVGAGIIGASIANHLSKAGAEVTVVDKVGPASHASQGTFAWINATWPKQPRHYHTLNQDSVSNWRDLDQELGLAVHWGGSIEWFSGMERQQRLAEQIDEQARWGEPARMLNAKELAQMEPHVRFSGAQQAAYSGSDGAVDPVLATQKLLEAAKIYGAELRFPCELENLHFEGEQLSAVETNCGRIAADKLVLATGAAIDVPARFAGIEIPQRSTPGVIAITEPMPRILHTVVAAPGVHMHQRLDGRIVIGEQEGPPQNDAHAMRLQGRPNQFPSEELGQQHAGRMMAIAQQFLPAIRDAKVEQVFIGWRPLPLDGHPVLGASSNQPDVYLAIMHSGVTLAPIVGQLVTQNLVHGKLSDRLQPFSPEREFKRVKRY